MRGGDFAWIGILGLTVRNAGRSAPCNATCSAGEQRRRSGRRGPRPGRGGVLRHGLGRAGWFTLALVIAAGCSRAPKAPPLTADERGLVQESFEQVWTTIRDKHWDPELGGLDWDAARAELEPELAAARTMSEAREVMRALIAKLDKSHYGIISRDAYDDLRSPEAGAHEGTAGIDVRIVAGRAIVTKLHPGSSAAATGVQPGWEILRIGDRDIPELIAKLNDQIGETPSKRYQVHQAVAFRLTGNVGETRSLRCLNGAGHAVDLEIPMGEPRGHKVRFGNMPAAHTWIDTLRMADGIGYVAFNYFFDPARVNMTFDAAVRSWMEAPGIILDLRGNPGGIGAMAMGMAGWFVPEKGMHLGTMYTRAGELKFIVTPRPQTYAGPVAILIDGLSASTSEILAGGMKDIGRARLFGELTAGAALPSNIERLPNGDGFQYAIANYVSQGGDVLEGQGVSPHQEVRPDRDRLLAGQDPVIEAAVAWIRQSR